MCEPCRIITIIVVVTITLAFVHADVLPRDCGVQVYDDGDRIIGNVTHLGEFPWMALLKYRVPGAQAKPQEAYLCGGALITRNYVLTAAHCVTNRNFGEPFSVTLGEYNKNYEIDCETPYLGEKICAPPVQHIPVERVKVHADFVPGERRRLNDIALIKLEKAANLHDYVTPICVPNEQFHRKLIEPNSALVVAGWGETKNRLESNIKKKGRIPIQPRENCSELTKYALDERQLCAGGTNEDSCRGDSGGPLMTQDVYNLQNPSFYITAIVSFGNKKCGTPGVPAIYTNVAYYLDWITANIA